MHPYKPKKKSKKELTRRKKSDIIIKAVRDGGTKGTEKHAAGAEESERKKFKGKS